MEPATKLQPTKTTPDAHAKVPMLVSYAFLREANEAFIAWLLGNPNVEWLLDSGAFTALNAGITIHLDEYLRFLAQWKDKLFGYIALDKLGDPKATDENLRVMLREGFKPVPVHVLGDDGRRMDELFELSDWVACGGLRRPHRGAAPLAYIKQKMVWAKGRNVHWLGYTSLPVVATFRPYSCDCSSWNAGAQWGRANVFTGGKLRPLSREDVLTKTPSLPVLIEMQAAGFTLAEARDMRKWRRSKALGITQAAAIQLAARAWVRYVRALRANIGTRMFLAGIPEPQLCETMFNWIDATLPEGQQPYDSPAPTAPRKKPGQAPKRPKAEPRKRRGQDAV